MIATHPFLHCVWAGANRILAHLGGIAAGLIQVICILNGEGTESHFLKKSRVWVAKRELDSGGIHCFDGLEFAAIITALAE